MAADDLEKIREKRREYMTEYRHKYREKYNAYAREWMRAHRAALKTEKRGRDPDGAPER